MIRPRAPAVAGTFYPAGREALMGMIEESYLHRLGPGRLPPAEPRKVYGAICPHAGYMYSGPVACHSFYAMSGSEYETFVILGPNHYGVGRDVAVPAGRSWETPLGPAEVDSGMARLLAAGSPAELDTASHSAEHSIEVQVPMIQHAFGGARILPVAMIDQSRRMAAEVGGAVARVAEGGGVMIIGSSDLTHYEPAERAGEKDAALLEAVLELDVDAFYRVLREYEVSACGYGAVAAAMTACRQLGATGGELLKYATSGDVTGDGSSVVGYCSVVFV